MSALKQPVRVAVTGAQVKSAIHYYFALHRGICSEKTNLSFYNYSKSPQP